tara:strand:- start:386 stop:616 length:231 start_codon:yes stop_codon:yes gene_type:complete
MPRLSITSNLREFPKEALLQASSIMEILAETNDEDLSEASELSIQYSIDTKNVFLSDSTFQIWILDRYRYNLKKIK